MRIDENFELTAEEHCWTLIYTKAGELNPKTGKAKTTVQRSYHSDIAQALKEYVNKALKPADSVLELLTHLEWVNRKIDELKAQAWKGI